MEEAVNHRRRRGWLWKEASPLVKGPVAGEAECTPLVGGSDEAEEELSPGKVEGRKAQFVEDDQVGAQEVVDDFADRVVSESAIQRLDQVGGGEIANSEAGVHGGMTETDEQVRLAGARWTNEDDILLGPDPLQRDQVVEGWLRHRGDLDLEIVQGLGDREAGHL